MIIKQKCIQFISSMGGHKTSFDFLCLYIISLLIKAAEYQFYLNISSFACHDKKM